MATGSFGVKLLLRWLVTAIALVVALILLPGISVEENAWLAVGVMAAVLSFLNAYLRPMLHMAACGCIVMSLGLVLPVINALTLLLASEISTGWLGVGFRVDGFWPALWGGLIVSAVSFLLNLFVYDEQAERAVRLRIGPPSD